MVNAREYFIPNNPAMLSPMLFNMYSKLLFRNALENTNDGVEMNGVQIFNIRYADVTVLIAAKDVETVICVLVHCRRHT